MDDQLALKVIEPSDELIGKLHTFVLNFDHTPLFPNHVIIASMSEIMESFFKMKKNSAGNIPKK